jgi:hypothetical protein
MKKLLLFVLCLLLAPWALQAQFSGTYQCVIAVKIKDPGNSSDHCTNNFTINANFVDGPTMFPWWTQDLNPIGGSWKNYSKTITFDGAARLASFWTKGIREYRSWDTYHYICRSASGSGGTFTRPLPTTPTFTRTYPTFFDAYDESVTVTVSPATVNMYYMTSETAYDNVNKDFPSEHPITLKAYPDAPYTWEYRRSAGTWQALPAMYQNRSMITLTGYDAFTQADFLDILKNNRNVEFRVKFGSTVKRTIVVYPKLSAPNIVGVSTEMESCYQSSDAQIKLCFSRDLKVGERLNIQLNGRITDGEGANITALDGDKCFTIHGLDPGDYDIKLLGTYDVDSNPDVDATYTGGGVPSHERSTNIQQRTAITNFNATPFNVHCHAGEDGVMTVAAQGGGGSYTAYLELDGDTIQQITFVEGALGTFQNLKASPNYIVRLKDANQCDPKETNGDIRFIPVEIKEPVNRVLLSTVEAIEPLGYGLHNGYITVRSQGGASNYTFAWSDIDNTSLTPEPPFDEGASFTSKMSGIGKGQYHARVEDGNYALASPATDANLRGCFDTLTIDLDQPPLLEVLLAQHRYVSCFGFDDGAMVAHAKGGRPYAITHELHPYVYEWFEVAGDTLIAFEETDSIAADRYSAIYRVKVTDRNGIIGWSPDFILVQPAALKVSFVTPDLLCNGDTNGTSHAIVTGGTPFYHYAWNTEDTTAMINNLTDDMYSIVITDGHGCTLFGQTEVTVPNSLGVEHTLDFPTCQGYTDGGIELTVTGGRTPYRYAWSNADTTATITDIGEGNYSVRITDDNGCFILQDYVLEDPALFNVNLGPDRTLCKEQMLDLNVKLEDTSAQYAWTKNGSPFAITSDVALSEPGTYRVSITDSKGCNNTDEIQITRNDAEIAASIIVASRAPQYDKVRIANISFPAPDRVEWIVPEGATVIEEKPEYLDLSFMTKGEYTIGLISFTGFCEKQTNTSVKIVSKSELKDYQAPNEPYIKQFGVTPNPNNGKFTATIQLREAGNFTIALLTLQGNVIDRYNFQNEFYTRTDFDVSSKVSKGVYVLQLLTQEGYATFKIVIQ